MIKVEESNEEKINNTVDSSVKSVGLDATARKDELDYLLLWNDTFLPLDLFSQIPATVSFVIISTLTNTNILKHMKLAEKQSFHFVEKCTIVNTSDESRIIPWRSFLLFRRGKDVSSSIDYPKYQWVYKNMDLQQTNDVIFAQDSASALKKMMQKMKRLLPEANGSLLNTSQLQQLNAIDIQGDGASKIQRETIFSNVWNKILQRKTCFGLAALHSELTDAQVLKFNQKLTDEMKTVTFSDDNISSEYIPESEVGYGENILETENEQKLLERDKTVLCQMINDKMDLLKKHFRGNSRVTEKNIEKLRTLCLLHWEAFGTKKSHTQISLLSPCKADLKADAPEVIHANPIKPKGLDQQEFMVEKVQKLLKSGLIKRCKYPRYSSAAFPVPKPYLTGDQKRQWRLVIDMRRFNDACIKTVMVLPNLEEQFLHIDKPNFLAVLDVLSGFDYLPTHVDNHDIFCFTTTFGVFTFVGAPQGWLNTPAYFSNRIMQEILLPNGLLGDSSNGYRRRVLQWIDDTLVFSQTFDDYLNSLERIFIGFKKKRVRLNLQKCKLLRLSAEFCGRYISKDGWRFQTQYFTKILEAPKPIYVHDIAQAMFVINWLSTSIPELSKLRQPFKNFTNLKGRKLKEIKREGRLIEWTPLLTQEWENLLQIIVRASKTNLQHYDRDAAMGLFTDASEGTWSLIIGLCNFDQKLPFSISTSDFKPMLFSSGTFTDSERNWTMSQKELFPILKAYERFKFLLEGHRGEIHFFTDHKNLVPILRPEWSEKSSYLGRLRRWSLVFQHLKIFAHHISSQQNSFADMLTRWAFKADKIKHPDISVEIKSIFLGKVNRISRHRKRELGSQVNTIESRALLQRLNDLRLSFIHPYCQYQKWTPPNLKILQQEQEKWFKNLKLETKLMSNVSQNMEQIYLKEEKILIPTVLINLYLFWIHVSCSHDSFSSEMKEVNGYWWELNDDLTIEEVVTMLRQNCLHCRRLPCLISRPYKITDIAKSPRDILHADFLYVDAHQGYILVIMDNFSRKCALFHAPSATSFVVAQSLLEWRAKFNFALDFLLVTDNGSHFSNKLLKLLRKAFRYAQKFSIANAPYTNGNIETINKPILTQLKQLCSEYRLPQREWPLLLPLIEFVINNKCMKRRKDFTPNQLFLGLQHSRSKSIEDMSDLKKLLSIIYDGEVVEPRNLDICIEVAEQFDKCINDKAEQVFDHLELLRTRENKSRNIKRVIFNFFPGDWVMYSRKDTPKEATKSQLNWIGPFQVLDVVTDNVYKIRSPLGKIREVHSSRMWFYSPNNEFKLTPEIIDLYEDAIKEFNVKTILDHKVEGGVLKLLIWWRGFLKSDSTWEEYQDLQDSVPGLIQKYVDEIDLVEKEKIQTYMVSRIKMQEVEVKSKVHKVLRINPSRNYEVFKYNFIDEMMDQYVAKHGIEKLKLPVIKRYVNRAGLGYQKEKHKIIFSPEKVNVNINQVRRVENKKFWLEEEIKIYKQCILKFGCGDYATILKYKYIVGKSKQQLYCQLQALLGVKAVRPFNGIHVDFNKFNFTEEMKSYYRDLEEDEKKEYVKRFDADVKIQKDIIISYFRRWNEPSHRAIIATELAEGKEIPKDIVTKFLEEDKKWRKRVHKVKNHCFQTAEYFCSLSDSQRKYYLATEKIIETKMPVEVNGGLSQLTYALPRYVIKDSVNRKFEVCALNQNLFQIYCHDDNEVCFEFFQQPSGSAWINMNVFDFKPKTASFDIVLIDPPWKMNGSDPVRGPSLKYRSAKMSEILKLQMDNFQEDGIVVIWVINRSYYRVLQWLDDNGYRVAHELFWLKTSTTGRLQKSIGHYFQHSSELCIVGVKGKVKLKKIKQINSHILMAPRRLQSQKPLILYQYLESMFPDGNYIELFGRHVNLRTRWITIGYQVLPDTKAYWIFLLPESNNKGISGSIAISDV